MADTPSKAPQLASNAVLTLVARGAMVVVVPLLGWNLKTIVDMQAAIARIPDQILVVETRLVGRVQAVDDRLGAQSRRLDGNDQRLDRLERPFFEPRKNP